MSRRRCGLEGAAWWSAALVATLFAQAACSDGPRRAPPTGSRSIPAVGHGGAGGEETSPCDEGAVRECKIQVDERNCFVGVERCNEGVWGECVEPDKLDTAVQSSQNCTSNPCNPYCQVFAEAPAGGLTAPLTASPVGGTIFGLTSSWQNQGLRDIDHAHAAPCAGPGDCQFDTYCDESVCNGNGCGKCVAWGPGEHGPTGDTFGGEPAAPNLTVPVVCGGATTVTVCNRGGAPTTGTIHVQVADDVPTNFSACSGFALDPPGNSCTSDEVIAPGACIEVAGCDLSGAHTITVNQATYPPTLDAPAESYCEDNWSVKQPGVVCSCTQETLVGTVRPVAMFLMLDNSSSMVTQGLWWSAKVAIKAFVQSSGADAINFAMRMYGTDGGANCEATFCSVANCASFSSGPQLLSQPSYEAALVSFIDSASVGGAGTPHYAAVGGLASRARAYASANPLERTIAVYLSDGDHPVACGGTLYSAAAIAAHASAAYADSPSVETIAVALPGASLALLDAIAQAGGQSGALDLTASVDVQGDLTDALTGIGEWLTACHVEIPNAGQLDLSQLVVERVDSMGNRTTLEEVAAAGDCDPSGDQYHLDGSGTEVVLCDDVCEVVRIGSESVEISGGCAAGYESQQLTFTYWADCSAFPGSGPQWDFLAYDTTVPGDAAVTWEVRTGRTEAELAGAPWVAAGVSSSADEDAYLSVDPEVLRTILGGGAFAPWLELRVTLTPTSGGIASPTVHDFQVYYSCLDNE